MRGPLMDTLDLSPNDTENDNPMHSRNPHALAPVAPASLAMLTDHRGQAEDFIAAAKAPATIRPYGVRCVSCPPCPWPLKRSRST